MIDAKNAKAAAELEEFIFNSFFNIEIAFFKLILNRKIDVLLPPAFERMADNLERIFLSPKKKII